jgi:hypothetical protein
VVAIAIAAEQVRAWQTQNNYYLAQSRKGAKQDNLIQSAP